MKVPSAYLRPRGWELLALVWNLRGRDGGERNQEAMDGVQGITMPAYMFVADRRPTSEKEPAHYLGVCFCREPPSCPCIKLQGLYPQLRAHSLHPQCVALASGQRGMGRGLLSQRTESQLLPIPLLPWPYLIQVLGSQ